MKFFSNRKGFTLIEVLVGTAIFLIFALGVYGGLTLVFKIVYSSRLRILETALLAERLEIARNLSYDSVGIINGVPAGVLPYTTTTVRNGITFIFITTVRNIDDPFDGTLGGAPNDTSPADYKLVEMSVICSNCAQQKSVKLSTTVAPKNLEGQSDNGNLFLNVFDVNGLPVVGATVDVTNTAATPNTIISDTTDNSGNARIIGAPTGTLSYHIKVSKAGYSSDFTVSSSASVPNPIKPPANVVSQTITELSFSIDLAGSINLNTIKQVCARLANKSFSVRGDKALGKDPDIYKYDKNLTTDGSGNYSFVNMEWDKYYFNVSGTGYDLAGSIPMLPLNLTPGLSQNLSLILKAHAANSLLVKVKDAGTGLPLANASVRLYNAGYDQTVLTGYGYTRQTDWSGGSGQDLIGDETKYFSDNGNLNINSPAGDLKLKKVGSKYLNSGWLESSTFDLEETVDFQNIIFEPTSQPVQTGPNPITFQLASKKNLNTSSTWDYVGPDGATDTYYTATNTTIYEGHNNDRYLRYKVFLNTDDTKYTPQLSEVSFVYTNSCTPPGQSFFSDLTAGAYTLDISHNAYTTSGNSVDINGNMEILVNLSPSV